jgi:D-serine deaminase-like pyridoxal phosphate-dependent protein
VNDPNDQTRIRELADRVDHEYRRVLVETQESARKLNAAASANQQPVRLDRARKK